MPTGEAFQYFHQLQSAAEIGTTVLFSQTVFKRQKFSLRAQKSCLSTEEEICLAICVITAICVYFSFYYYG